MRGAGSGHRRRGGSLSSVRRGTGRWRGRQIAVWAAELESVFARVAGRFARADLRWRMRDCVRGLLGRSTRKNGWQLAEWAGHRTPDGFQRLLNSGVWDADALRDDVRDYVAEQLGPDGC
ncbi:transposase [Streptomyces olivaceoviridis]|uniref:Transposase n=2 Tax=Streptomyces olivaceoviridis TaxID=1921 RepID=A0ABW7VME5_STROI